MKAFTGNICGKKKQSTTFVGTGTAKGSYPVYVCDRPAGKHSGKCYDSVHNVHF